MGGSSGKTNRGIALTGATGAEGAASNLTGMGAENNAQSNQLYNTLWGAPSGSGGTSSGGALSGFLDPSKLNVTAPTGNFAIANTTANENAEKASQNNAESIKQSASNAGFGANAPAGFTQDQLNQNQRALADTEGQNFNTNTQNSYQAALNNFWNSANMANSTSNTKQAQAGTDTSNAGSIYNNLYGTSSKTTGGQGGNGQLFANQDSLRGALQGAGSGAQAAMAGKG